MTAQDSPDPNPRSVCSERPTKTMTMDRRSLLLGLGGWSLSQLLNGCGSQAKTSLSIQLLRGSVPAQVINEFHQYAQKTLDSVDLSVTPVPELKDLFVALQTWQQSGGKVPPQSSPLNWVPFMGKRVAGIPDWVTLGDSWLSVAIAQKLVQPLAVNPLPGWAALAQHSTLKALVTRNANGVLDPNGSVWGVPYRIGSTAIAYRRDLLQQHDIPAPTDWHDLWNPALRGKISLLAQPREVIGLALKKLGKSYNTANLSEVSNLMPELRALQQQVKLYRSTDYLQPLLLKDTWVAVGWSTDILPLMQRSPQIAMVIPRSGTALWADLWVRPAGASAQLSAAAADWINFYGQPNIANLLTELSWAMSPALLGKPRDQLPKSLQNKPGLLLDSDILQQSEFLAPLSSASIQQYQATWDEMRKSQLASIGMLNL